jgi:phosphonate transport system substrate-binding protein
MVLRVVSHLAPGLPHALFETLAQHLHDRLSCEVALAFDEVRSGPSPGADDPFRAGTVDLAFLCATAHVWLSAGPRPSVHLLAGPVPTDPRADGRPRYCSDVLATHAGPRDLHDLVGCRVAYNDLVSLSGYHGLRLALTSAGIAPDAVTFVHAGSHLASLDLLADGEADAAAVDANVWRRRRRERPDLARRLRGMAVLGPHPSQPVVARRDLDPDLRRRIRDVLLSAHLDVRVRAALADAELVRFAPMDERDIAPLRAALAAAGPGRFRAGGVAARPAR